MNNKNKTIEIDDIFQGIVLLLATIGLVTSLVFMYLNEEPDSSGIRIYNTSDRDMN